MEFFSNIYQLQDTNNKILNEIKSVHKRIELSKNSYLLKEGEFANSYFCIESGLVRSYLIDYNGNEITTNFFSKNEIAIGIVSLFTRIKSQEFMHALEDCIVWEINLDDFYMLFNKIDGFADWGRNWMTKQYLELKLRTNSIISNNSKTRYLELLKSQPDLFNSVPQKYIASYIGITETSFSHIRKELFKKKN